ncbi:MAG: rod-binding protein [Planctomycetaceae bacterium]|jgi:Rod binding domain-containing protein|nr:rod-binding protein [Planctomycetaceae bacterium]
MVSSVLNFSGILPAYEVQSAMGATPKTPAILQTKTLTSPDIYERADGSEVVRQGLLNEETLTPETPTSETPTSDDDKRFREVLHQFVGQTLFGQMLKSMRATQEKNPYFHGGRAEEIFQSQLDMVLTDKMTQATSKTLSDPMYKLMKTPK